MNEFLRINTNVQIATSLVLIVFLLGYIAYKLSEMPGKKRHTKSAKR
ncbi:MAG TPA: hypothetical protein VJC10_01910 [Patescibacteria group bacterium]|nr:hypothetical protein [Patescibacteria group bacterium]